MWLCEEASHVYLCCRPDRKSVEHLLIRLPAICVSEEIPLAHFLVGLFSYYRILRVYCIFWINSPLSDVSFTNIFSQSVACLFILLIIVPLILSWYKKMFFMLL